MDKLMRGHRRCWPRLTTGGVIPAHEMNDSCCSAGIPVSLEA
jgi:hypothetical protein